ncbi:MAG: carbon storage regulator [Planctomycetaceae bacterium]|nr:carbon storage regulator [Planctomycetaceae bacterium]
MLVLSRKLGEKIVIGDGIEVMVVAVVGNRVRLGIAAPQQVRILRAECRPDEKSPGEAHDPGVLAGSGR